MELIKEAGLNTLLGMGMTFLVLISLSLIIAMFGKLLNGGFSVKKDKGESGDTGGSRMPEASRAPSKEAEVPQKAAGPDSSPAAEAPSADSPEEDDALLAVIAAAVAAYEGDMSPEIVAVIGAAVAAYEAEAGPSLTPGVGGFAARKIRKSRRHVA